MVHAYLKDGRVVSVKGSSVHHTGDTTGLNLYGGLDQSGAVYVKRGDAQVAAFLASQVVGWEVE